MIKIKSKNTKLRFARAAILHGAVAAGLLLKSASGQDWQPAGDFFDGGFDNGEMLGRRE